MIISSNEMDIRIYEKKPDVMENGIIKEYGIYKDILAFNLTKENISDDMIILVPGIGEVKNGKRFGKNGAFSINLNNNIFIEFTEPEKALLWYKMLLKIKDENIKNIEDIYPEFFV
jgi:hypothetical protein